MSTAAVKTSQLVTRDLTRFDGTGITDQNTIARARLDKPDQINKMLTFLQGRDNGRFPLTFLTEGQDGGMRNTQEINGVEYYWEAMGAMEKASTILASNYTAQDTPGVAGSIITVTFADNLLKNQHIIVNKEGTQCRVTGRPVPALTGGWLYRLQYLPSGGTMSSYINYTELLKGTKWIMGGPGVVSESLSFGNESNVFTPGKLKNQINIMRKSYHIGGNISNKVVDCTLVNAKGQSTNLWMDWEEWQHEMMWKEHVEWLLWRGNYNRLADGRITTIDEDTGLPIPMGAGVVDQIYNTDTYSTLTTEKLRRTVLDVVRTKGYRSDGPKQIVLYTGIGGKQEFHRAINTEASGVSQLTGDKFVTSVVGGLAFGNYFVQYKTNEGDVITVKDLELLNEGPDAIVADLHPETGLPLSSYEMYFIDQSSYDGVKNIQMVTQKGRQLIRGMEQGMSLYKGKDFGDYRGNTDTLNLATSQDKSSIHFLSAKGVCINNSTKCFKLLPSF